jgi:hypothetical protein
VAATELVDRHRVVAVARVEHQPGLDISEALCEALTPYLATLEGTPRDWPLFAHGDGAHWGQQ